MTPYDQLKNPGFLVADVHRQLRRVYTQRSEKYSLCLSQAKALMIISKHPGVKQKELADKLEIQPMTMAKLLDQLAEMELIRRERDPNDRRAHLICLTELASPYLVQIQQTTQAVLADVFQDLSTEETQDLIRMLNVVRDRLSSL